MLITCPECAFAREVGEAAIPSDSFFATCPKCGLRFRFRAGASEAESPPAVGAQAAQEQKAAREQGDQQEQNAWTDARRAYQRAGAAGAKPPLLSPGGAIPWESPGGFLRPAGFLATLLIIAKSPKAFFSGLNPYSSVIPSCIFLILVNAAFIWNCVDQLRQVQLSSPNGESIDLAALSSLPEMIGIPLLMILLYQFLSSICIHGVLRILAPDRAVFRLTFKAVAYSRSPMLLVIIPQAGPGLASLLSLIFLFLGVHHACRIGWGKTVLSVLPFLFFTLLIGVRFLSMLMEAGGTPPM